MSRFASGVTVVTTIDGSGKPAGFTASAFASLSLEPPLVLVCLDKKADSYPAFRDAKTFAISFLSAGQSDVGWAFASKGPDKFSKARMGKGKATGNPVTADALVELECEMHAQPEGGDHVILIGKVLRAYTAEREPLLFYNRQFGGFTAE